jgi:hypothetical protein
MNRLLVLGIVLSLLAGPLAAEDPETGDAPAAPASQGYDPHINEVPLGHNGRHGGSAGGAAGVEGPTDPSIMYLKDYHLNAVYEHHKDFPIKQMSYGVFRVERPKVAVAVAFYSRVTPGRMSFHYCDITRAATSASACGFITWISEKPNGRPLCASDVGADIAGPPKPAKKYYCNLSALGWDGDNWTPNAQPGMMGETCIGLRSSTPYDSLESATAAKDEPSGF